MEKTLPTKLQQLSALSKTLGHSVHNYFTESLSFFKDELSDSIGKTGRYINLLTLPVNNYLKDIAQINKEFEEEIKNNAEYCICLDGEMVPASEVLSRPMEENY